MSPTQLKEDPAARLVDTVESARGPDVLPQDGPARVGGIDLPAGKRIRPRSRDGSADPVLWMTDDRRDDAGLLWKALGNVASETGLVPVLLDAADDPQTTDRRPWDSSELQPVSLDTIDDCQVIDVMRSGWELHVPLSMLPEDAAQRIHTLSGQHVRFDFRIEESDYDRELIAPWNGTFPGLALEEATAIHSEILDKALQATRAAWIGLVPVSRAADIPCSIGWEGPTHTFNTPTSQTAVSVFLRSWEDRFGARLLRLGFATMELLVQRPPSIEAEASAIAAEHFAFAGTGGFEAYSSGPFVGNVRQLAARLQGAVIWRFSWN